MKRAAYLSLVLFITAILYSSCKEEVYMDWKTLNDRYYATLEDTVAYYQTHKFYYKSEFTGKDTSKICPFQKTESGIYYQVIHQGVDKHPNKVDAVFLNVKGTLINSMSFLSDSLYKDYLSGGVPGWQEIIPKMQVNGHYIMYLPYKMGFDTTTFGIVPPYSVLKYDIILKKTF